MESGRAGAIRRLRGLSEEGLPYPNRGYGKEIFLGGLLYLR
jgi:hypothetical protein